jgi:3-hydroxyisobutyrate dehydrogenase
VTAELISLQKISSSQITSSSMTLPQLTKVFTPQTTRLGWVGVGVMGVSMAKHCFNAGYTELTIFSRTQSKAQPLIDLGAKFVNSPKEVALNSDVLISMVGFPHDVRQVLLDRETGALAGLNSGSVLIDMTTSEPSLAREIAQVAEEKGVYSLDIPVSGGDIGARNATLTMMIGGDKSAVEAVRPLLQVMGKSINYMGGPGSGQHTKMANQIIICTKMVGVCEGLLYAYKAGLDVEQVFTAVSGGAANSFSLQSYGPRILKRDMQPGFYVEHFVKDLRIALDECTKMNLVLPGLNTAKMLYEMLALNDGAKLGTQALILALEKINNIEMPQIIKTTD